MTLRKKTVLGIKRKRINILDLNEIYHLIETKYVYHCIHYP